MYFEMFYVGMLETVVLLIIFLLWLIKSLKEQHLFKIEIFSNH